MTRQLPVALYCLVGLGLVLQGVRYFGAVALMPYHMAVIDAAWDDLADSYQTLFLGLLKGFGAGSFCVGLSVILLALGPLRTGSSQVRWVVGVLAVSYCALLVYVTSSALLPGAVPVTVTIVLLVLVVIAAVGSFFRAP